MSTQDDVCARASKDLARRLAAPAIVATTLRDGGPQDPPFAMPKPSFTETPL